MTNGVLKSGFIEHRWVQNIGKRANFANTAIRQLSALGREIAQLPAGRRNRGMKLTDQRCQRDKILAGGIVQVPADAAALLVLQAQELTGQAAEFMFDSHAFGDVTASACNANRLSFFIMKGSPTLLEDFDAAIRRNDPIFDRAR